MAAQVPEEYRSSIRTVGTMLPGESGWIVGWGLIVDLNWYCWLRADFTIKEDAGGTVDTLVCRRTNGNYDILAPVPLEGWRRREITETVVPVATLKLTHLLSSGEERAKDS